MAQMFVYSYEQLVAIVNQQAATIAKHAAVINNLQSERQWLEEDNHCLLYTSPSPRDGLLSRMPSSA